MRFCPRGYCGPLVGSSCHGDTQKRVRKCAPDSNFKRKNVCHSRRTRRRSWYGGLSSARLLEYMPSGPGKRFATARALPHISFPRWAVAPLLLHPRYASVRRSSKTRRRCWYGLLLTTQLLEGVLPSPETRIAPTRRHGSRFSSLPVCWPPFR